MREVGSAGRVGSAERIREKRVSGFRDYPFAGESRAAPREGRGVDWDERGRDGIARRDVAGTH